MRRGLQLLGAAVLAGAIFAVMDASIRDTAPWHGAGSPDGAGGLDDVIEALFGTHVLALEVLGILLTAAMIGALVIARPLGQAPDASHYRTPTESEFEATQHLSDVREGPK